MPIPYVKICTPPIPPLSTNDDIDSGASSFAFLDHIDFMHGKEKDDCDAGKPYCNHGAISALTTGGQGEIVTAGFPSYNRPRSSETIGEKAGSTPWT